MDRPGGWNGSDHAVTKRQSRKRKLLCLFLEKSSKDLQRSDYDEIAGDMVLAGLPETEEAEALAWDLGNLEVLDCELALQFVILVSTINFRPRGPVV